MFEQVEQIPLTISYGNDIIKTQRERDSVGNQLKQIEKKKKLLTKKQPHDKINELLLSKKATQTAL